MSDDETNKRSDLTSNERLPDVRLSIESAPALTPQSAARTSLGVTGPSIPTHEHLRFQLDHALARDAVHTPMNLSSLLQGLRERNLESIVLKSAAATSTNQTNQAQANRQTYLRRPDLGRTLDPSSQQALQQYAATTTTNPDIVIAIADGLSALAIERHALPLIDATLPLLQQLQAGPVCIVQQGRVAIGDEIGSLLKAKLLILLIGERPGLTAPDSLSVYITWQPHPGRTDAERNCISNIRLEGLSYAAAAHRIAFYVAESKRLQTTGIALKEAAPHPQSRTFPE